MWILLHLSRMLLKLRSIKAASTDEPPSKAAKAADAQAATCTYAQATADVEAKFKDSMRPTTASRLSGSLTGCSTFQAYSAGCVGNMVIVAESASCAEKNATAIAMANTITQAEQHVSQELVDLNVVDPQQQQAGC